MSCSDLRSVCNAGFDPNEAHVLWLRRSLWASLIVGLNTWPFCDMWAKSESSAAYQREKRFHLRRFTEEQIERKLERARWLNRNQPIQMRQSESLCENISVSRKILNNQHIKAEQSQDMAHAGSTLCFGLFWLIRHSTALPAVSGCFFTHAPTHTISSGRHLLLPAAYKRLFTSLRPRPSPPAAAPATGSWHELSSTFYCPLINNDLLSLNIHALKSLGQNMTQV